MRSGTRLVCRCASSEPVVLCTQTANDRSMRLAAKLGFTEVERFEEYGAEQWFGVVLGHAVRLNSCSTARRIHDETERIGAHFTTVTPTSDRGHVTGRPAHRSHERTFGG